MQIINIVIDDKIKRDLYPNQTGCNPSGTYRDNSKEIIGIIHKLESLFLIILYDIKNAKSENNIPRLNWNPTYWKIWFCETNEWVSEVNKNGISGRNKIKIINKVIISVFKRDFIEIRFFSKRFIANAADITNPNGIIAPR